MVLKGKREEKKEGREKNTHYRRHQDLHNPRREYWRLGNQKHRMKHDQLCIPLGDPCSNFHGGKRKHHQS